MFQLNSYLLIATALIDLKNKAVARKRYTVPSKAECPQVFTDLSITPSFLPPPHFSRL